MPNIGPGGALRGGERDSHVAQGRFESHRLRALCDQNNACALRRGRAGELIDKSDVSVSGLAQVQHGLCNR